MNLGINEIKELTFSMLDYPCMDYTNYSLSFLKRRLSFVFTHLNIKRKDQFIELLKKKDFREKVLSHMQVENTEMFRDPAFWRYLRDKVIDLLPHNTTLWLPNESSGEEIYSLSVILHERNLSGKFRLQGNNPSIERCQSINQGLLNGRHFDLNQTNYRRLEEYEYFDQYFSPPDGHMVVCEKLRENVSCIPGTVFETIPEKNVALILFRNVAIYYNHRLAGSVFNLLYDKLMPGGFLVIGVKEQLPVEIADKMIVIDETEKIYKKPTTLINGFH